mgnify:CR=1 FL=1
MSTAIFLQTRICFWRCKVYARNHHSLLTYDSQTLPLYYLGRSVVNLHANHHYSSLPALNAVIQAEYSYYQRDNRPSSSASEPAMSPNTPQDPSPQDLWKSPRNYLQHRSVDKTDAPYSHHYPREQHSTRESTPREFDETWELREIIPKQNNRGSKEIRDLRTTRESSIEQEDNTVFIHERESSVSSTYSQSSQRSSNSFPHQIKSPTSSDRYSNNRFFYTF